MCGPRFTATVQGKARADHRRAKRQRAPRKESQQLCTQFHKFSDARQSDFSTATLPAMFEQRSRLP
jgi:hypothetical protein